MKLQRFFCAKCIPKDSACTICVVELIPWRKALKYILMDVRLLSDNASQSSSWRRIECKRWLCAFERGIGRSCGLGGGGLLQLVEGYIVGMKSSLG